MTVDLVSLSLDAQAREVLLAAARTSSDSATALMMRADDECSLVVGLAVDDQTALLLRGAAERAGDTACAAIEVNAA